MTGNEIATYIRETIVEPVAAFWSNTFLLQLINDAEVHLNTELHYLEKAPTLLNVTAGGQTIDLPTDFVSEKGVLINLPDDSGTPNWIRLHSTSLEKKLQENPNFMSTEVSLRGDPSSFFIYNRKMYLDPIPETTLANSILLFYTPTTTPLTTLADTLNFPDTFKEAIYQFVLWKAWAKEADEGTKASAAKAEYEEGVKRGRREIKKLSLDRRNRIDIESPVPFSRSGSGITGFNPF